MFYNIDFDDFAECLFGVFDSPQALQMREIEQHSVGVTCYEHCLYVAYISYILAKSTGHNARLAARGAMLHDMYLTKWSETNISLFERLLVHPQMAYQNACVFNLSDTEADIITNHMWPLTRKMPKTPEGKIVSIADKLCASAEMMGFSAPLFIARRMQAYTTKEKSISKSS